MCLSCQRASRKCQRALQRPCVVQLYSLNETFQPWQKWIFPPEHLWESDPKDTGTIPYLNIKQALEGTTGKKKTESPLKNHKFKCRVWKSYVSCQDASSCPIILLLSMLGLAFLWRQREMKSVLAQNPKILWYNSYHKTECQMDNVTFLQEGMTGDVGNESLPQSSTQCSNSPIYILRGSLVKKKSCLPIYCLPHAWYEKTSVRVTDLKVDST